MKKLALILLFGIVGVGVYGQTIKTLGYNTTNGQVVAETNVVWTNAFNFSNNLISAQVRTNLLIGWPVLTNTNIITFRKDIGLVGTGTNSVIGGGDGNIASQTNSVVSGGAFNTASGPDSMVLGGIVNSATGTNSSIIGGNYNTASGRYSIIGGQNSTASGESSTVLNGLQNTASGQYSVVIGGAYNTASGYMSTVNGGFVNIASADYTFAAGRRASATNAGSFVWADSTDADFSSTNTNSFNIRARGGVSFDLGTNGISFRNITNAAATRTNLGLGNGITTNRTFVSYNGTNYTTNSVTISNGIITGWTQ